MSEILVKTNIMTQCVNSEQAMTKKLNSLAGEIEKVQRNLSFNVKSRAKISTQLLSLSKITQRNADHVSSLASVLSNAAGTYSSTEKRIAGNMSNVKSKSKSNTSSKGTITSEKDDGDSTIKKILKDDWKLEGSVLSGKTAIEGTVLGFKASGSANGDVLGGSIKTKSRAKWKPGDGDAGVEKTFEAEGHLTKGKAKGNIGLLGGEIGGTVGSVGVTGKVGASLFKNGKFSPTLDAKVTAEAAAAKGNAEVKLGTDEHNAHIKGKATLLGAEAEAGGSAGVITYKDGDITKTEVGVKGKVGAEAYLAKGSVSGGFTIFGIEIDAGIEGKAGAIGVSAEGRATTGGVSGKIGGALGLGGGIEISIDWSNFSLW